MTNNTLIPPSERRQLQILHTESEDIITSEEPQQKLSKSEIIQFLSEGLTSDEIVLKYDVDQKLVASIAEERHCFELLSNPRRILALQLGQLIRAADEAVNHYLDNPLDVELAHAISPLVGELRAVIGDVQELQDPQNVANQVLDSVIQPLIRQIFKNVAAEMGAVINEAKSKMDERQAAMVEIQLKQALRAQAKQATDIYRTSITNLESVMQVSLDDRRQEILVPAQPTEIKQEVQKYGS